MRKSIGLLFAIVSLAGALACLFAPENTAWTAIAGKKLSGWFLSFVVAIIFTLDAFLFRDRQEKREDRHDALEERRLSEEELGRLENTLKEVRAKVEYETKANGNALLVNDDKAFSLLANDITNAMAKLPPGGHAFMYIWFHLRVNQLNYDAFGLYRSTLGALMTHYNRSSEVDREACLSRLSQLVTESEWIVAYASAHMLPTASLLVPLKGPFGDALRSRILMHRSDVLDFIDRIVNEVLERDRQYNKLFDAD